MTPSNVAHTPYCKTACNPPHPGPPGPRLASARWHVHLPPYGSRISLEMDNSLFRTRDLNKRLFETGGAGMSYRELGWRPERRPCPVDGSIGLQNVGFITVLKVSFSFTLSFFQTNWPQWCREIAGYDHGLEFIAVTHRKRENLGSRAVPLGACEQVGLFY